MKLNEIKDNKGARQSRVRVGRGIGSGLGKTAGRGQKGAKARSGVSTSSLVRCILLRPRPMSVARWSCVRRIGDPVWVILTVLASDLAIMLTP